MAKVLRLIPTAAMGGAFLLALVTQVSALTGKQGASIAPHRAVYEITLDHATPGSGVAEMTGRMVYEMSGSSCKGYEQKMRFVTRMTNQEGIAQINDLRTSSFEDLATHHLRFSSSQYENQKLSEAAQGSAGPSNGATFTKVELTKPSKKTVKLPSDIYFPIQHSLALLEAAHSGKTIFTANLYDGSDKGEKFYETNAVIGKPRNASVEKRTPRRNFGGKLDGLTAWPVAISYFEPGPVRTDQLPTYELSFLFYENGISSDLFIDYGDFSIRGELKELTLLKKGKCPPGKR